MARPPTLLGLTLLLPLLLLPWAPTRAGPGKVVVLAPTELRGSLGDTVTLPCHLQPPESETPRVTQIRFGGDLTIHELSPGDEANYTCKIQTSTAQMGRASTWLRVFYAPQVSMALYEDTGQQGRRETSLSCHARSNPQPKSYNWSTTTGPLPPSAVPQGSRLLIQPTEETINTTFICHVSNDLGTGQVAMTVLLPGSPREPSHSPSSLWILLPIGIVFVAVLGALVYSRGLRQSRQDRHSASTNGAVSYAAVESEACNSQEPPTEGYREQRNPPGDTEAGRMT